MRSKILRLTGFFFAAVFLAAAQLHNIELIFGERINEQIAAAEGIVKGLPHWRVYQNRILGPFLVQLTGNITGLTFGEAYLLTTFVLLCAFFLVLSFLSRKIWKSDVAALATVAAAWTFNSIFMNGPWLYPWDYIDLTVFTLLTWAILTSQSLWLIGAVLFLEIFNREIVIILSLWLFIDAVFRFLPSGTRLPKIKIEIHYRQIFLALGLLIIGFIIIETLRRCLLIREIGPEFFPNVKKCGYLFNVQLLTNLQLIFFSFKYPLSSFVFNILILWIPVFALVAIFNTNEKVVRVSFLYLIMWIFTVVFGIIYEPRVWISFVPFLVLVFPAVFSNHHHFLARSNEHH